MLGKPKVGKSGKPSAYNYPSEEEWGKLRPYLVNRSKASNPNLDQDLTAYTPGETLTILNNPKIRAYHDRVSHFRVPDNFDTIVLVPCAKSKPWGAGCKSNFYKAYHQLMGDPEMGKVYMATISEPLGVVPSSDWENFPQYDNPGLFDDTAMQSSLMTKDWGKTPVGSKRIMPFDVNSYNQSIDVLSKVIASFMKVNSDKRFVAFVDDPSGKLTTHGDMLNRASSLSGIPITRFSKKPKTGREKGTVYPYMKSNIRFKEWLIEQTFNEFERWLQVNNIDMGDLIKQLQSKEPDGHGGNAVFYKIPGTQFGVKIIKGTKGIGQLRAADDELGDENYGQAIAHYGSNIQILKLQSGIPAGHPYKYDKDDMEGAKARYLANLESAAGMPVSEYERLFRSIKKLNDRGWVIDPSKSGNLLIDRGRFNLVDINKHEGDYRNNAGEVVSMLIDNFHFGKYFTNDMRVKGLAKQIIEKADEAAARVGFPYNKESSTSQYSHQHAYGPVEEPWKAVVNNDKEFGWDHV